MKEVVIQEWTICFGRKYFLSEEKSMEDKRNVTISRKHKDSLFRICMSIKAL